MFTRWYAVQRVEDDGEVTILETSVNVKAIRQELAYYNEGWPEYKHQIMFRDVPEWQPL